MRSPTARSANRLAAPFCSLSNIPTTPDSRPQGFSSSPRRTVSPDLGREGGLDNGTIARRLVLSNKSVRNRVSDILAKLHAGRRAEMVALARDAGRGS
ncbi:MAG TPA: LuxR C-terminal-related transcriptional regulator [Trueperaceae bacterium]|nr:LuxR C-terminal-related transcriptional regulator [Trueperaceae bacterium]